MQYEGYGPGGTAVLIECSTPQREELATQLRRLFVANGGYLGARGSVSYLFARTGVLTYPPTLGSVPLTELALAAGAEDVQADSGGIEILTDPEDFPKVREALQAAGFVASSAQVTQRAATGVEVSGATAEALRNLVTGLHTLEEVQDVYTNARFC